MTRIEDRSFKKFADLKEALKQEYPHKRIYTDETFANEGVINISIKYPKKVVAIVACTDDETATGNWQVYDSVHDEPKDWYE